ncbi:MAG: chemotaxis protein CheA, partial [candidate division Zixibacteria bacterium]|nr:chemotaxis protein CheA [candidate division Zixibacteria bacterium]
MTTETDFELDEMKEIIGDFLIEADELITSLDNNLVTLESSPDDLDLLNEIFRAVHTIKGTSSFLGFEQVTALSHKMEDILNKLRKAEMKVCPEIMDVLLEALDLLKLLLNNVRNENDEQIDLDDILARLQAKLDGDPDVTASDIERSSEVSAAEVEAIRVEATSDPATFATASTGKPEKAKAAAAPPRNAADQTIRVDVDRLDALLNMTGELVLSRNSLMQSVGKLGAEGEVDHELEGINRAAKAVNFITTELQMAVMKMRMQPVGKVFSRFPRQVRDLARESDKKINLVISGESTELDKSVIEEIGDPLMHIIRNSCDHGLESPEERRGKGKPEQGTVHLSADQEGSHIIIKVEDDGRGFDIEAIRDKAVERGLIARDDVDRMPDREVFDFIFEAGFSTAKKITDVSGRGVGMDVVRTNIQKLNGTVDLDSRKDIGSTITIKLPLTLAIVQGLLVQCDEDVFVLPLSSVHETVKASGSEVYYVNQRPVFRLRDEIIPLINLTATVNADSDAFVMSERPYIVVVGLAERKLGLMIDRFLGQEEVVIKSLGEYLGATEGVAGATILGDG